MKDEKESALFHRWRGCGGLGLRVVPAFAQVRVFLDVLKAGFSTEEVFEDNGEKISGKLKIEVSAGEVLQVPVFIQDGEEDAISYSFRVKYKKKVLKLLEISGGTFEGFSEPPVTNRATFESGKTDFTAHNAKFLSTPDTYNVATITFEVIGRPRRKSVISIHKTPRTDITLKSTFGQARKVSFKRRIIVRVR